MVIIHTYQLSGSITYHLSLITYQVQSANEKLLKLVCSGREREEEETKSEGGKGIFGRTRTVRNRDVFVEQDIEDKQLRTKPKSTNVVERGTGKRMEGVKMLRAPVGNFYPSLSLLGLTSAPE